MAHFKMVQIYKMVTDKEKFFNGEKNCIKNFIPTGPKIILNLDQVERFVQVTQEGFEKFYKIYFIDCFENDYPSFIHEDDLPVCDETKSWNNIL